MFPFPFTELRLIHDEKVHKAMEQARIDAEFARGSQRIMQLSLFSKVLKRIHSVPNIFSQIELLRRSHNPPKSNMRDCC